LSINYFSCKSNDWNCKQKSLIIATEMPLNFGHLEKMKVNVVKKMINTQKSGLKEKIIPINYINERVINYN